MPPSTMAQDEETPRTKLEDNFGLSDATKAKLLAELDAMIKTPPAEARAEPVAKKQRV
eukprot:SAG11_NODE_599_length_8269_cov_3.455080_1_plen_58_part_00